MNQKIKTNKRKQRERQTRHRTHYTEWAAIFATGAELTKRNYDVALTLGRTPKVDLLCSVPEGEAFKVQVKGMSNHVGPFIQPHFFINPEQISLFFIIVNVPSGNEELFEFFIMTHRDIKFVFEKLDERRKRYALTGFGLSYQDIRDYKNKWEKLPPILKKKV